MKCELMLFLPLVSVLRTFNLLITHGHRNNTKTKTPGTAMPTTYLERYQRTNNYFFLSLRMQVQNIFEGLQLNYV